MKKIVVFDAGHGGKDPGAVGSYDGGFRDPVEVREKDLTLNIAKLVQDFIIQRKYPIVPVLTRSTDVFVGLKKRCFNANYMITSSGSIMAANYFVSIHHNARPRPGKYGIELEVFHCPGSSKGKALSEAILRGVIQTLQLQIDMPVFNRGVKTKAFYVLKYTKMPATLLELGFVSDREEAEFLDKYENQRILAVGIIKGLMDYLDPTYFSVE